MDILLKKNIYAFLLLLAGILFVGSCKPKKDPQPVPIPCEQLADFKIYETYRYQKMDSDRYYDDGVAEGDTFLMAQGVSDHRVFFEAKQEGADKYEWWIGNESTPRVGKKISVLFLNDNFQINTQINIRLRVTRKDRTDCSSDGVYIQNKNITLLLPYNNPIVGKYVTYDENNQPKIIEIYMPIAPEEGYDSFTPKIKNLIGSGSSCNIFPTYFIEYQTAFSFLIGSNDIVSYSHNCRVRRSWACLDKNNRNRLILTYYIERSIVSLPYVSAVKNIIAYRVP